jgi:hypothetical protein
MLGSSVTSSQPARASVTWTIAPGDESSFVPGDSPNGEQESVKPRASIGLVEGSCSAPLAVRHSAEHRIQPRLQLANQNPLELVAVALPIGAKG